MTTTCSDYTIPYLHLTTGSLALDDVQLIDWYHKIYLHHWNIRYVYLFATFKFIHGNSHSLSKSQRLHPRVCECWPSLPSGLWCMIWFSGLYTWPCTQVLGFTMRSTSGITLIYNLVQRPPRRTPWFVHAFRTLLSNMNKGHDLQRLSLTSITSTHLREVLQTFICALA